ncbi:MAG TPA: protein translocase subunit SecD [Verrucomicrobiota bacterium]|nr:protein translocase subunit SecD [Verrucomicrobiota bacterium]
MNRKHLGKLLFILFIIAWAVYEMYPPKKQPLIPYFAEKAYNPDDTFRAIVERAQALQKEYPEREYKNLEEAIGTNDITRYFPYYTEAPRKPRPTQYILNQLQREAAGQIRLGIDLAGGTSFLMRLDANALVRVDTITNELNKVVTVTNVASGDLSGALSQAIEVLRKRVDAFGVAEPVLQPQGSDRILVQLPGLSEEAIAEARETLSKVAFLEFKLVHPDSEQYLSEGRLAAGFTIMTERSSDESSQEPRGRYLVKRTPEFVGGVRSASVHRDDLGRPIVVFSLEREQAEIFARVTREHKGELLAIVLDGELMSAPRIDEPIEGGRGMIRGNFTDQEARALANVLQNPLRVPLVIEEERTVDPSLGADSIRSGVTASIVAAAGTFAFMLVFYFASGLVANLALLLNVVILMGAMCLIDATLTMPGIAGIALTIGMAVDANVLIYERMREEIAAGKSIRGVIQAGYNKAFGTIFDSNLTTAIAALILIYFGTGPVQGFGVTLFIGIAISMFTALYVTRLIYDILLDKGWLKNIRMLPLITFRGIRFVKWGRLTCSLSALLIVIGLGYGIFVRGSGVFGIDFQGGDSITMTFQQKVEVDQLRNALTQAGIADSGVGYQTSLATGHETLQLVVPHGGAAKAEAALKEAFPEAGFDVQGIDSVGASVGEEVQTSAIIASLLAIFAILVYVAFRYEFSFAMASVIALVHDVLLTFGIFFLAGKQLSAPMVAAILTIFGYSINDKIVIMDRIREDLKLGVRGTFAELIDIALNQTLGRTVITGGAVVLATLSLLIFGGGVIEDFAFAFLVGILSGTYSSIFIASPILLWWHKGQRPKLGAAQMSAETAAAAQRAT